MPKIYVEKNGKKYRIEAHTLPEALRQGATIGKKAKIDPPIELLMPIVAKQPVKVEPKVEVKEVLPEITKEVPNEPEPFEKPKRTRKK